MEQSKSENTRKITVEAGKILFNGNEVKIKKYLPQEQKEQIVKRIAEAVLVIHEDNTVTELFTSAMFKTFIMFTAYTDINVKEYGDENEPSTIYRVYDEIMESGADNIFYRHIDNENYLVLDMYDSLFESIRHSYEHSKSLEYSIQSLFENLMGDESLEETVNKSAGMSEFLLSLISRAKKGDKAEREEKGELKMGKNNLINFSKRK